MMGQLPRSLTDREQDKFIWDPDETLGTLVKVFAKIAGGQINILSPTTAVTQVITVTDTVSLIPRNANSQAMDFKNLSETNSFWIATHNAPLASSVAGTANARRVNAGEGDNFGLDSAASVWVICESGKTVDVEFTDWVLV
jgi:hypothetical protein